MSFCTNEARQFLLAKKHNDVKGSYVTTGLVGNIVDAVTHVFLIGGFGFHLHSINSYSKDYPQGPNIIFPFFNDEHLISYCPFNLPTTLIYAQASYRFQILKKCLWILPGKPKVENWLSGVMDWDSFYLVCLRHTNTLWSSKRLEDRL